MAAKKSLIEKTEYKVDPPVKKKMVTTKEGIERPCDAVTLKPNGISFWSKIKFFIQLRDWVWSVPIFTIGFFIFGKLVHWAFGYEWGFYDPAFIQPAVGAIGVVLIALNGAVFIVYFYFRTLHRYWFGQHKPDEKIVVNYSIDDFKSLQGWQRVLLLALIVCFFVYVIVRVYLAMK